jgi:hypothetical protein
VRAPTKATYLRLENDPAYHFDFFLAEKLGLTVRRLRREISNHEYQAWAVYYARKRQQQELAARKGES